MPLDMDLITSRIKKEPATRDESCDTSIGRESLAVLVFMGRFSG